MTLAYRIMLFWNERAGWAPCRFQPGKWHAHVMGGYWAYWP